MGRRGRWNAPPFANGGEMGLKAKDRPEKGLGSWTMRRRFMWVVISFCMWTVAYILMNRIEGQVPQTAIWAAFVCIILTMGSYVFGAAWQDVSFHSINKQFAAGDREKEP